MQRSVLWGSGAVLVLLLSGCGGAGGGPGSSGTVSPSDGPAPLVPAGVDPERTCALVGFFGGVYVDLADVLDPEGGPYFAEVEAQGERRVTSVEVRDDRDSIAYLDPDLEFGVEAGVDVVVRSGEQDTGPVVWTGTGGGTPTLTQPNGAGCGDVYTLALRGTPGGELVPAQDVSVGGGDPDTGAGEGVEPALNEVIALFREGWTVDPGDFNQAFQVPVPGGAAGSRHYVAVGEFLDDEGVAGYASALVDVAPDGSTTVRRLDAPLTLELNASAFADRPRYDGEDLDAMAAEAQRIADEADDVYS